MCLTVLVGWRSTSLLYVGHAPSLPMEGWGIYVGTMLDFDESSPIRYTV